MESGVEAGRTLSDSLQEVREGFQKPSDKICHEEEGLE